MKQKRDCFFLSCRETILREREYISYVTFLKTSSLGNTRLAEQS